jgi:hypothetical protein
MYSPDLLLIRPFFGSELTFGKVCQVTSLGRPLPINVDLYSVLSLKSSDQIQIFPNFAIEVYPERLRVESFPCFKR